MNSKTSPGQVVERSRSSQWDGQSEIVSCVWARRKRWEVRVPVPKTMDRVF